jgi:hypothetical protein
VVRLSSGVGNQLFQYAFALYLKEKYQDEVYLEDSFYVYRSADRERVVDIVSVLPVISDRRIFYRYKSIFFNISKALFRLNPFVRWIKETELRFPANDRFLYFDGYWQTDAFIREVSGFRNYFQPKEEMPAFIRSYLVAIQETNSISLHVRRGDYFSDAFRSQYGVCESDYYHKAVRMLMENVGDRTLFVFSDELDWVRQNLKLPANTVFIENKQVNPYWYVHLMSYCQDNILSNSSFSWWGAYLNEHPQKQVIAPATWIRGKEGAHPAPESWILI